MQYNATHTRRVAQPECAVQGWTDIQSHKEEERELREEKRKKVKQDGGRTETRQERAFKPAVEAGSGREAAVREEEERQEGEGEQGVGG